MCCYKEQAALRVAKVIKSLFVLSSSRFAEKHFQRSFSSKSGNSSAAKNPVVRSKSYNVPMLTPVVEYDPDASAGGGAGIRRHSVSEMTSCIEENSSVAESATAATSDASTFSLANQSPASTTSAAHSGGPRRVYWTESSYSVYNDVWM